MTALRPLLREGWEQSKSLSLALAVHIVAFALIWLGTMNWTPFKPPQITGMTIEAVMVDTQALTERRERALREAEEAQRREAQRAQRQRELEAQRQREREAQERAEAEAAERQRQEAERKRAAELRLQELRKRQQRERDEEAARLQAQRDELQRQREALARQSQLEAERLKQLDDQRQAAAEAEAQKQREAELQRQLAAEEAQRRQGQRADLRSQYMATIQAQVTADWKRPPTAQPGLRCTLAIVQIPGGEVISATIRGRCNGDEATRRSLVAAVERAGTLPYRGFEEVFEREINFVFRYDGD